jgi:CheY-like chemotaxis protein
MAPMDGIQLSKQLRLMKCTFPIVGLSSVSREFIRGQEHFFDEVLEKPVPQPRLTRAFLKHLLPLTTVSTTTAPPAPPAPPPPSQVKVTAPPPPSSIPCLPDHMPPSSSLHNNPPLHCHHHYAHISILIVEDHDDSEAVLEALLKRFGYLHIERADNAETAIDHIIHNDHYDICLLTLN